MMQDECLIEDPRKRAEESQDVCHEGGDKVVRYQWRGHSMEESSKL